MMQFNLDGLKLCNATLATITLSSISLADIYLDQIGPLDGSGIIESYDGSQDFESTYDIYDYVVADNFIGDGSTINSIELVLGGWNGFIDPSGVTGYNANLYTNEDAAGASLVGDIDSTVTDAADASINSGWEGYGFLISFPTSMISAVGDQLFGVMPVNEFAINGQTGIHKSLLGDAYSAIQANPAGGFGFGPWQETGDNAAYRLIGYCEEGFDCNNNSIDDCEDINKGNSDDCNYNTIPDECDIANGTSNDGNGNGVPDECETYSDCNDNGVADEDDIANGTSADCNYNGIPDECDIADGTSQDTNGNGIPDECDPIGDDCNQNGIDDVLDIKSGFSYDCDDNWVPDECQPDCDGDGFIDPCDNEPDCDSDGIPDNCEADCNENDIPDDCDIIWEISEDVNEDGIPDECQDCNKNGIPDPVDIADGTSEDADGNGIPDECQYPVTWTVDDDGKADFDNIQAAIDAASSLPNLDDILVYPGTYPAGINMLGKEVWLHSSDGPDVTIIDGEETQHGIVCNSGETLDTIIEGFTVSNCDSSWPLGGGMTIIESSATVLNCIFDSNVVDGNGGGILINKAFPNISGCQFINNTTSSDSYPGGGIISVYNSHPTISDTLFCGNFPDQISGSWTDNGGTCISVSCDDSDGDGWPDQCGTVDDGVHHVPEEFPTIQQAINAAGDHDEIVVAPGTYSECEDTIGFFTAIMSPLGKRLWIHSSGGADVTIIDANQCHAGIFISGETTDLVIEGFTFTSTTEYMWPTHMFLSAATFRDCIFTGGTSSRDAADCRRSTPEFEGCKFTNNAVAVSLSDSQGGSGGDYGTAKFTNCTFSNNGSGGDETGSCIYMTDGMDLEVSNCLFEYNSGSAIIYTGSEYTDSVITDCVFRNNEASGGHLGGVIFEAWQSGNLNMQGCLFENNTATYQFVSYPKISEDFAHLMSDSEFKNNTGTGILVALMGDGNSLNIENSTITGNSVGGISEFIGSDNTTITNTTVCGNGEFQIAFEDWIDGGGNTIAEVCFDDCQASDITDDGIVDVSDILAILGYWGSSIPAGDVDGNGVVDIGDLLMVVGNWGPCE